MSIYKYTRMSIYKYMRLSFDPVLYINAMYYKYKMFVIRNIILNKNGLS